MANPYSCGADQQASARTDLEQPGNSSAFMPIGAEADFAPGEEVSDAVPATNSLPLHPTNLTFDQ